MLRSMKDLNGFTIGASDGDIGTIKEYYFDDVSFTVRYVVVKTGGWLSQRKVLLSPFAFRTMDWEHKRIRAALTKAQVEKSPDIDTDKPVSRQHEIVFHGYYGHQPYWTGSFLWGEYPYPYIESGQQLSATDIERERRWNWDATKWDDPHLRSSLAVTGYHIQASDGDIGHVEDFLVDERSWSIRYMIVDTTNWWAGKKVLVAPAWIERVDWAKSNVHVHLKREQIRTSPEYDPVHPIERSYETLLYGHYARPHYWDEPSKDG